MVEAKRHFRGLAPSSSLSTPLAQHKFETAHIVQLLTTFAASCQQSFEVILLVRFTCTADGLLLIAPKTYGAAGIVLSFQCLSLI